MASRVASEVVERRVYPTEREAVVPEAVADVVVAIGVVRDEQSVHSGTAPVSIGAAEKQADQGELQLHVCLLRPVGAFIHEWIALAELDSATARELRVVQQMVVPASSDNARHHRRRPIQVKFDRRENVLITLRPQWVAMSVAQRLEPNSSLRMEAHFLWPPCPQELDLVGQLLLDRRNPLHLLSGQLTAGLRFQDRLGDVDPAVGLHER